MRSGVSKCDHGLRPVRRRLDNRTRLRSRCLALEGLEDRQLLAGGAAASTATNSAAMFWTDAGSIYRAHLDGSGVEKIYTGSASGGQVSYIDIDPISARLYQYGLIGDRDTGTSYVRRCNLDGTGQEDLITSGLSTLLYGFALDVTNNWMYIGGVGMRRAHLDGSGLELLPPYYPNHPYYTHDIEVDAVHSDLYYTDAVSSNGIKRANLDGTNVEFVLDLGGGDWQSTNVALDVPGGQLYYTQYGSRRVGRINVDGTSDQTLVPNLGAFDIELDSVDSKLYWTTATRIQRSNLDGSNIEDLVLLDVAGEWASDSLVLYRGDGDGSGPIQWSENGHWYDLVFPADGGSLTWEEAKLAAEKAGGHLATVTSAAENDFLAAHFASQLYDNGYPVATPTNSRYAWIGLMAPANSRQWSWVTGEPVSYTNWAPYEPWMLFPVNACVHYWTRDFGNGPTWSWNDEVNEGYAVTTGNNRFGYIVEFDDAPVPAISLTLSPGSVIEDGTANLVYTFTRTGPANTALTVNFAVSGTATYATDYVPTGAASFNDTSGTVTFAAGSSTAVVTIDPEADTAVEPDETVVLTLTSGTSYTVGSPNLETGIIVDNDKNGSAAMFWTDAGSIYRAHLDGSGVEKIYTGSASGGQVSYIDIDPVNAKLYQYGLIGDRDTGTSYVRRCNLDGTGQEDLITSGLSTLLYGFALNVTNNWMYIGGVGMRRAHLDGSGLELLPPYYPNHPYYTHDIEVDAVHSDLYYTDAVSSNGIKRANLDGTDVEFVLNLGDTNWESTNIALDVPGGQLYYTQYGSRRVGRINMDGTGDQTLVPNLGAFDIELDSVDSKLYWTTATRIQRSNLDGSNIEDLVLLDVTGAWASDSLVLYRGDEGTPAVSVAVSSDSVMEDDTTNLLYTFTRTGPTTSVLTVNFAVSGTASSRSDYNLHGADSFDGDTGTVTFAAGSSTATLEVDPLVDGVAEPDETVVLTLTSAEGYSLGSPGMASGNIDDDDPIDIAIQSFATDGNRTLSLTYAILCPMAGPLDVGFYRSPDATYETADSMLGMVRIDAPEDLTVGVHTKAITIGNGLGELPLPGAGNPENDDDYTILAVADPANTIAETDGDPWSEDNTAALCGAYHLPGGDVYVHGTSGRDLVTISSSNGTTTVNLNCAYATYGNADFPSLRIRAHAGNDIVDGTAAVMPIKIRSGDGDDLVSGGTADDIFVADAGTDTFLGNAGNDEFLVTSGSATIDGGSGVDIVYGPNSANSWQLISTGAGSLNNSVNFKNLENLVGGPDSDNFAARTSDAGVTGFVNGGGGSDTLIGPNSSLPNGWTLRNSASGTLNGMSFRYIGNLTGGLYTDIFQVQADANGFNVVDGGSGTDTLVGLATAGATNLWDLTGAAAGTLNGLTFAAMENLTGGADADRFLFRDSASGFNAIQGSSGMNTFDFSLLAIPVTLNLQTRTAPALNTFWLINSFVGSAGTDTMVGPDTANNWNFWGTNSGYVNGLNFSDFEHYVGGSGSDTFGLRAPGATASGGIDGGAGTDTLIGSNSTTPNAWNLTGNAQGTLNAMGFASIERVTGGNYSDSFQVQSSASGFSLIDGAAGTDTLTGPSVNNTWDLTGVKAGSLNAMGFMNIENLSGGPADDRFQFHDAANVFGAIQGGSGGTNTLDYSLVTIPVAINLGNKTASKLTSFWSINRFTGGTTGAVDILTGPNATNNWMLTGTNSGTLGSFSYSDFEKLVGGTGTDTLTAPNTSNAWTLNGAGTGTVNGLGFANMENVSGGTEADTFTMKAAAAGLSGVLTGGAGLDSLVGFNNSTTNQWNLSDAASGTLNGISFTSVENLTGGLYADMFQIQTSASGFNLLDGSNGTDTLVGANLDNAWNLTGVKAGTLNGLAFIAMENLTGGSANDLFQFHDAANGFGAIHGGSGGTDALDYSLVTGPITVNLGARTAPKLTSLWSITVVVGTGGDDFLTGGTAGDILIGGAGADTLSGDAGRDLLFGGTGIDLLHGGAGEDVLIGGATTWYSETTRTLNLTALSAILTEWKRTDVDYATRCANLHTGTYKLDSSTIQQDALAIDQLFGDSDRDWFLADSQDQAPDQVASGDQVETLTRF